MESLTCIRPQRSPAGPRMSQRRKATASRGDIPTLAAAEPIVGGIQDRVVEFVGVIRTALIATVKAAAAVEPSWSRARQLEHLLTDSAVPRRYRAAH